MNANSSQKSQMAGSLFGASLTLLGILTPILGALLVYYPEIHLIPEQKGKIIFIIFATVLGVSLSGLTAGFSLVQMCGRKVPIGLAVVCMWILIGGLTLGSIIWALYTVI